MVAELSSMMEAAADDDYEEDDSGDEYDSQDSDAENCLNNSGGDWYYHMTASVGPIFWLNGKSDKLTR